MLEWLYRQKEGKLYADQELEKLWDLFGDISLDNDDGISEEFLGFQ